jgi:hypothetical protein
MLPEAEGFDPHFPQRNVHREIAGDVALDLGGPEPFVAFWGSVAAGAFVPKAAIDEYRHFLGAEIEIGLSWKLFVDPIPAHPLAPDESSEKKLGLRVFSADFRHQMAPLLLGHEIHGML